MPEPKRLMLAGDWHGNGRWAKLAIQYAANQHVDAILQVGDFGYWPDFSDGHGPFWDTVHQAAEENQIPIYWLDGNHENHYRLKPGFGDQWLRHLPRGHRWTWWGKTWMAVGGGVSVDKKFRTPGHDWFPEETLNFAQFDHCLREGEVDIIVSHDCPDGVLIPGVHALDKQGKDVEGNMVRDPVFPPEQIAESEEHRGLLGEIVRTTNTKLVFHGHYHRRYQQRVQLGGFAAIGLGMDGESITGNTLILDRKTLEGAL